MSKACTLTPVADKRARVYVTIGCKSACVKGGAVGDTATAPAAAINALPKPTQSPTTDSAPDQPKYARAMGEQFFGRGIDEREVLRDMAVSTESLRLQLFEDTISASVNKDCGRPSWAKESVDAYTKLKEARTRWTTTEEYCLAVARGKV